MELTKEFLERRLDALKEQSERLLAQLNATGGAIATVQELLNALNAPPPAENDEAETTDVPKPTAE